MREIRKTLVLLSLAVAALGQPGLLAQQPADPASQDLGARYAPRLGVFEEMTRKEMAADHTTGLAIGFMIGGETWTRAYGLADVENGSSMKPNSSFRLASITKPMTAVAVLQLVEQGKIDLDAEIQTYVPPA